MEEKTKERPRRMGRIVMAAAGFTVLLATVLILILVFKPALTAGSGAAETSAPGPALTADSGAAETSTPEPTLTAGSGAAEISALEPLLTAGSGAAEISALEPLLYTKDGNVSMASGGQVVQLEGAKTVQNSSGSRSLNAAFCENKKWLFYIANYDRTTGEGDLMRVATDGLSKPELVVQSVCDAKVSVDGQRVLYTGGTSADSLCVFDMAWDKPRPLSQGVSSYALSSNGQRVLYVCGENDTGSLYSWNFSGEPELIAQGISAEFGTGLFSEISFDKNYGFSPDAKNIYYIVKTPGSKPGKGKYTLYEKIGSREAEKVSMRDENSFLSGTINGGGPLGNNGQMMYFSRSSILSPSLYLYSPGGETEHFTGGCAVWAIFGDGSFLLSSDHSLYYKAPGQEEQRLSKHMFYFPIFGSTYYELRPDAEKRFLLLEDYTDFNEGIPDKVTVFEQQIGEEKTELCEMDGRLIYFSFDPALTKVAYKLDGALYFIQKENGKWSEPECISDTGFTEIIFYTNPFDKAGTYMYYRQLENEDAKSGGLYRYTIKRHKSELLLQDVSELYLMDDIPYAITAEGALYRADTGVQLAQGVDIIWQADGGIHISAQDGILYYGKDEDKPVTLCEGADIIRTGGISYLPPMTDDVAAALDELCDDAQRCIDVLEAGGTGSFQEYQAKADALKARRDVSAELDGILDKFSMAFMQAGMWAAYEQTDIENGKEAAEHMRVQTIEYLSDAIKTCREYLKTQGDK